MNANLSLRIRGSLLQGVDSYDYLGVRLDNTLTSKQQIGRTVTGCNSRIFTLSKMRYYIPENTALTIYKSLILSKLTYGGVVAWSANAQELDKLQKVQNRALRIGLRTTRYTSNLTIHNTAKLHPLYLRRKLELLKLMFRRSRGMGIGSAKENHSDPKPKTRYNNTYPVELIRPHSTKFQNSVAYQGPKLWASLPREIKNSNNINTFTKEVKKLLDYEMTNIVSV